MSLILGQLLKLTDFFSVKLDKPADEVAARISTTTQLKPPTDANLLVIEAIPELLEPKQTLFKTLSAQFKGSSSVILATNTSSLACSEIGKHVEEKATFAGKFAPVLELIKDLN